MLLENFFVAYLLDELNRHPENKMPSIEFLVDVKRSTYLKIQVIQLNMFKSYCFDVKLASYGNATGKALNVFTKSSKISTIKNYPKCFDALKSALYALETPIAYEELAKNYLCHMYNTWIVDEKAELIQDNMIRITNLKQNRVNTYTLDKATEKLYSHLRYLIQNVKKNTDLDNAFCILEHCFN